MVTPVLVEGEKGEARARPGSTGEVVLVLHSVQGLEAGVTVQYSTWQYSTWQYSVNAGAGVEGHGAA